MWRSWLAHLLWEQGVLRSSRSIPTIKNEALTRNCECFFLFYPYTSTPKLCAANTTILHKTQHGREVCAANTPILHKTRRGREVCAANATILHKTQPREKLCAADASILHKTTRATEKPPTKGGFSALYSYEILLGKSICSPLNTALLSLGTAPSQMMPDLQCCRS